MRPQIQELLVTASLPVGTERKSKTLCAPDGGLLKGDSLLAFRSNWGKEIIDIDHGDNHEKWTNGECRNKSFYRKLKTLGLNCVRMFIYRDIRKEYKNNWFEWEEIIPVIDDVVSLCAEFNLTLILDYHPVPCGKANFSVIDPTTNNTDDAWLPDSLTSGFAQESKDFWNFVAPLYSHLEHVVYEIQNEPYQWSETYLDKYYTDSEAISYQGGMYSLVRSLAPDTPLIMWSFPQARGKSTAKKTMLSVVRRDKTIKYKNAVVGFHAYAMDKNSVTELAEKKPVLMTEFSDQSSVKSLASYQKFIDFFTDNSISWIMLNLTWAMRRLPGETLNLE